MGMRELGEGVGHGVKLGEGVGHRVGLGEGVGHLTTVGVGALDRVGEGVGHLTRVGEGVGHLAMMGEGVGHLVLMGGVEPGHLVLPGAGYNVTFGAGVEYFGRSVVLITGGCPLTALYCCSSSTLPGSSITCPPSLPSTT